VNYKAANTLFQIAIENSAGIATDSTGEGCHSGPNPVVYPVTGSKHGQEPGAMMWGDDEHIAARLSV
jgi:hypothetical protein